MNNSILVIGKYPGQSISRYWDIEPRIPEGRGARKDLHFSLARKLPSIQPFRIYKIFNIYKVITTKTTQK